MGGIRGRRGRKKDRIYERVRRRVCLSAPLTALLPALSQSLPLFIAARCLSNSYPTLRTRAYFSLNTLPRSRRGYNSLRLQTEQLTFPRHSEYHPLTALMRFS